MNFIKKITVVIFCFILLLPIIKFNTLEGAVSEIDNRELASNPLKNQGDDFTNNVENYVNDRIGFRNEMISAYTILNDKLFGKMVHPSYTYGKEGYVFGAGLETNIHYDEYHEIFADMVRKIQDYCDERNVPFLFVFNPAKPAVMTEYIAEGINYDRQWVTDFFYALDERGIRYLDNTETLKVAKAEGADVYNKKFDANHWNDIGAYYGTNAILTEVKRDFPEVHVNNLEDVYFYERKEESLLVSKFPINEMVPTAEVYADYEDYSDDFQSELILDDNYSDFGYYRNPLRMEEGAPKALVFQGSYMNQYGYKYLQNAFGEYIYVHDYQNVLNFPYYYNIFKPDCVIFEVAEYTLDDIYFNFEKMQTLDFQKSFQSVYSNDSEEVEFLQIENISVEEGKVLTTIEWDVTDSFDNAWLFLNDIEYDLQKMDSGYVVTVLSKDYSMYKNNLKIAVSVNNKMRVYK